MKPKKGITADFDRIEDEIAVLYTDDGQRLDYPASELGAGCEEGSRVRILVVKDEGEE